eukprot:6209781-Pleurochrysis_carterae.AAC.3
MYYPPFQERAHAHNRQALSCCSIGASLLAEVFIAFFAPDTWTVRDVLCVYDTRRRILQSLFNHCICIPSE